MAREHFIGDIQSVASAGIANFRFRPDTDAKIKSISIVTTGRAKIDRFEIVGALDMLTGRFETNNLKKEGNFYNFLIPVNWKAGQDLEIVIADLSGATNEISVLLIVEYE